MNAMAPEDVKRVRDMLGLKTTDIGIGDFWMLVSHNGSVCIHRQKLGEQSSESIDIPRRTFQKMVEWYQKPQEGQ